MKSDQSSSRSRSDCRRSRGTKKDLYSISNRTQQYCIYYCTCIFLLPTGVSTFTGGVFTDEIMKISENKFQFHGSIRCRWMDKKTIIIVFSFSIIGPWGNHYIKNCFFIELDSKRRIQVGHSWSLVDTRGRTHFLW